MHKIVNLHSHFIWQILWQKMKFFQIQNHVTSLFLYCCRNISYNSKGVQRSKVGFAHRFNICRQNKIHFYLKITLPSHPIRMQNFVEKSSLCLRVNKIRCFFHLGFELWENKIEKINVLIVWEAFFQDCDIFMRVAWKCLWKLLRSSILKFWVRIGRKKFPAKI